MEKIKRIYINSKLITYTENYIESIPRNAASELVLNILSNVLKILWFGILWLFLLPVVIVLVRPALLGTFAKFCFEVVREFSVQGKQDDI